MTFSRRSAATALAVLFMAGTALVGCGSSSSKTSANTSNEGATTTAKSSSSSANCDIAPSSLISADLGINVGDASPTTVGSTVVCSYVGTPSGAVTLRIAKDSADLDTMKAGFAATNQSLTPIGDLGDEAFSTQLGSGQYITYTVVTRKGTTSILVSSSASIDKEETLVRHLLTKV